MKAEYIDHMGTDLSIVNAARVSFAKESEWAEGTVNVLKASDEKLIRYLAKNNHWSPFSHTAIILRMSAPVPIRTQCFKHKQGFVENEESRRYISTRPELYVPDFWRTKPEGSVKQGSGAGRINIESKFSSGFCSQCGTELRYLDKGGQLRKYCSNSCKTKFKNSNRDPYKTVFWNCQARVKREGKWDFDLSFDELYFPEYCTYTGLKLDYSIGKGKILDNSPSFDRINPSRGYSPDNVQIISHKANTMKSSANREELISFAKSVLRIHGGYIDFGTSYVDVAERMIDLYMEMVEAGVAPEQARLVLPQGVLVNWIWTGNLASYARFYNQRTDPHAQKEVQDLARMVGDIIEPLFPVSWKALTL